MSVHEGTAIFSAERPGSTRCPARLVIRVGLHVAQGPPLTLRLCPSRSLAALASLCLHISGCLASSAVSKNPPRRWKGGRGALPVRARS